MKILIVDDEPNIRKMLRMCLEDVGHDVFSVGSRDEGLHEASRQILDLVFVDLRLGTQSGYDLIEQILSQCPWTKIVVITAYASIESAVKVIKLGATDYLPKPFAPEQVLDMVEKVVGLRELDRALQAQQNEADTSDPSADFASRNPALQRIWLTARQVAATSAPVLLQGENGTGKNVLARALHAWSPRARKPLSVVSCPSLSAELLESEMFGHARGAFTGAVRENPGRVALTEGGTLLLDEIGAMPVALQPKLLRFLQDREYNPVGNPVARRADVRMIAATNQDLAEAVRRQGFREDLLYRLNVITLVMPPLRDRREDIVPMAENFLGYFARRYHKANMTLSDEAVRSMMDYEWPGNVRELRNAIERACILSHGGSVGPELLQAGVGVVTPGAGPSDPAGGHTLESLEIEHIRRVLAASKSMQEAAAQLGINTATLWRKRKQYGL